MNTDGSHDRDHGHLYISGDMDVARGAGERAGTSDGAAGIAGLPWKRGLERERKCCQAVVGGPSLIRSTGVRSGT